MHSPQLENHDYHKSCFSVGVISATVSKECCSVKWSLVAHLTFQIGSHRFTLQPGDDISGPN